MYLNSDEDCVEERPSCRHGRNNEDKHFDLADNDVRDNTFYPKRKFEKNELVSHKNTDPFSPCSLIPLPTRFGMNMYDAPCFRRRNERERERVRCVNDGYIQLKERLPVDNKEKRLSKVDTLRCAIQYIKYLQNILSENCQPSEKKSNDVKDKWLVKESMYKFGKSKLLN